MLPLTEQSYRRLLDYNQYNIFNNSNIKAVFINASSNTLIADYVFGQSNPYTYLSSITSSPNKYTLQSNLGFNFAEESSGNKLQITGKISLNGGFTTDGTTDTFIFLVDDSVNEVVSYVKLASDTSNTIMNSITEIAFTDDIMNTNELYGSEEYGLSAGYEDFIQGAIALSSLKVCIIKDNGGVYASQAYSEIYHTTTIQELSDVAGGSRIKVVSSNHTLSGLGVDKYFNCTNTFIMSLTAEETIIYSSPATQGFSPPYRAILYDVSTQKPLLMFSEDLGIIGQDNIFVKANQTGNATNILTLAP